MSIEDKTTVSENLLTKPSDMPAEEQTSSEQELTLMGQEIKKAFHEFFQNMHIPQDKPQKMVWPVL